MKAKKMNKESDKKKKKLPFDKSGNDGSGEQRGL
jgi:hypothetical protein